MSTSLSKAELALDVPAEKRPRHIAIIMDGNGRWARRQGLPRIEGHRRGVASVRRTVEECARLHIEQPAKVPGVGAYHPRQSIPKERDAYVIALKSVTSSIELTDR